MTDLSENQTNNKVAFITGAAHGQGRAVALALASEGINIVAFDVAKNLTYPAYTFGSADELSQLQQDVEALGREADGRALSAVVW